jgi:hypothetical protein
VGGIGGYWEESGGHVVPWGRMHPGVREDLVRALKRKEAGSFWEWREEGVREFR